MASAKEYFQMKREELQDDNYDNKLIVHRRKRIIIITVIVSIVLIAGIIAAVFNMNRTYHSYDIINEIKRDDDISTVYLEYQNKFIKYNMDGISCVDLKNKLVWNQSYEMKNPLVDICDKYVVVCDRDGNKIYVFNQDGIQGEVETKLPVKKICVAGQGTVAVLMQDENVNYIDYYDKTGKIISENKAPIEKTGYPMDLSLSNDGLKLAVAYMMIENATIQTKLAFYNFDSVGENEIDHLVSAANYENEILPQIEFIDNNTALVFGSRFFEVYEGTQKPKSRKKVEFQSEIKSIFYNKNYVGFVFDSDNSQFPYCMKIYNLGGKLILEQPFSFEYDSIQIKDSNIYMHNGAGCQIYNLKGKLLYEGSFEEELKYVIPVDKKKINLVFSDKIRYVKLK